jgi:hypothetical protein
MVMHLLTQIGTGFTVSLAFGFAALKIYDLFIRAFREQNRLKIWWAFTSAIFLFVITLFLFTKW